METKNAELLELLDRCRVNPGQRFVFALDPDAGIRALRAALLDPSTVNSAARALAACRSELSRRDAAPHAAADAAGTLVQPKVDTLALIELDWSMGLDVTGRTRAEIYSAGGLANIRPLA